MKSTSSTQHPGIRFTALFGVSLLLGLLFNTFFFGHIPGLSVPSYIVLIVGGLFFISFRLKLPVSRSAVWLLLPLVFFGSMLAIRASAPLSLLNIAACLVLLLLIAKVSLAGRLAGLRVGDYVRLPLLPFKFFRPLLRTTADGFNLLSTRGDRRVQAQVLKGAIITVPVLLVFLLLFSSADLIFQKYAHSLLRIQISPETVVRTTIILFATLGFIGAYSYAFGQREAGTTAEPSPQRSFLGPIESSMLFGSVNVLFLTFILIQLAYLFGGLSNISGQGFTYAEYARRGFFELLAVAVISFLLIWTAERYTAKSGNAHNPLFKALNALLVVQVIVIMASAFKRLWLYEEAYGFTSLRLYSQAFVALLAVVFVLLLYKILTNRRENTFALGAFIAAIASLALLNLLNPDAFIARQNIDRFASTGKLDAPYIGRLSSDAYPETVKALRIPNQDLAATVAQELYWQKIRDDASPAYTGWQSWNLSRQNGQKILQDNNNMLDKYKAYMLSPGSNDLPGRLKIC